MNDSDVISGDVWLNVHVEVEQWQVKFLDRVFLCGIFRMLCMFKVINEWFILRGGCVVFQTLYKCLKDKNTDYVYKPELRKMWHIQ